MFDVVSGKVTPMAGPGVAGVAASEESDGIGSVAKSGYITGLATGAAGEVYGLCAVFGASRSDFGGKIKVFQRIAKR